MSIINFPILYAPDPLKGRPLGNGQIFVGEPDLDPEIPVNQKQLNVVQEDGTLIPVPQPFVVSFGGVPTYNGATVRLDVDGNYSFKMLDKLGVQKYYVENVFEGQPVLVSDLPTVLPPALLIVNPQDQTLTHELDLNSDVLLNSILFPENKKISTKGSVEIGDGGQGDYIVISGVNYTPGIEPANDILMASGDYAVWQIPQAWNERIALTVGNDVAGAPYDFAQLSDALQYCTSYRVSANSESKTPFQITIPAGTHEFEAIQLRNIDASGIQVYGAGVGVTFIKAGLANITDGTWLTCLFSTLGDWGGFTLLKSDATTVTTNYNISGQRWNDINPLPPWSPEKEMAFIAALGSQIGRFFSIDFNAGSGDELTLGNCLDFVGTIATVQDMTGNNIRECMSVYNGSVIHSNNTFNFDDIYVGGRCHEATVYFRNANLNGLKPAALPLAGSNFFDAFRGKVTLLAGFQDGFDDLMLMSGGEFIDQTPAINKTNINNKYEFTDNGNLISTKDTLPEAAILSSNKIITVDGFGDTESILYTGDGASGRIIPTGINIKKVSVRNMTTDISVAVVHGQLTNIQGATALWLSTSDGLTRVYGAMNTNLVDYEMIVER